MHSSARTMTRTVVFLFSFLRRIDQCWRICSDRGHSFRNFCTPRSTGPLVIHHGWRWWFSSQSDRLCGKPLVFPSDTLVLTCFDWFAATWTTVSWHQLDNSTPRSSILEAVRIVSPLAEFTADASSAVLAAVPFGNKISSQQWGGDWMLWEVHFHPGMIISRFHPFPIGL